MEEDNSLCNYFEAKYCEGHFFERGDYEFLPEEWCWHHKRTKIKVWADAIDLSLGRGGGASRPRRVVFHYTDELAFRRIVESEVAAEIWASLVQSGGAQGIYTVPKPPDEWQDKEELLENNYRQMMKRDREDPEKGGDYVSKVYPLKVAYCIPILLSAKAHDLCKEPPEPKARKAPQRREKNLQPRQVVTVCLADGEGAIRNASARLLETLRLRVRVTPNRDVSRGNTDMPGIFAKHRLGDILLRRGHAAEAEPLLRDLLASCEEQLGEKHPRSLSAMHLLALATKTTSTSEAKKMLRKGARDARKLGLSQQALGFMRDLGLLLQGQGEFLEAEELFKRVLRGHEELLGSSHPETMNTLGILSELLQEQGEAMEAEKIYCHALNKGEELLGAWHPWTSNCGHHLGCLLQRRGKLFKAGERFRQALAGQEEQLGCVHPETLATASHLAKVLQDQGRLSEAEDFFRRAMQGREELGAVQAVDATHDLATFFRSVGKLAKANSIVDKLASQLQDEGKFQAVDELYRQSIKRSEEQLGPTHPSTLTLLSRLAVMLQEQGKSAEAEFLQRQALRGREKVLGPSHPETLVSSSHLGYLCCLRGNLSEAEKLISRAVKELEQQLDSSHLLTLVAVEHMGFLLQAQGRLAEAEKFFKRTLRGRDKQLGQNHPDTVLALHHLAAFTQEHSHDRGHMAAAEELWRRAECPKTIAAPRALQSIAGLARNLREQSKFPEAIEVIKACAERLQDQGHLDEAASLLQRSHRDSGKQLGEQHPVTLTYLLELANVLAARAKPEAKETLRLAVKGRHEQLGLQNVDTLKAQHCLADYLRQQAEIEAEQLLKQIPEGFEALDEAMPEELEVVEA